MERKEAIEVIKKNWPDSSFTMLREALETLIPELKESEDERIRKELLNYLYDVHDDDKERARWIAWLEKQGGHANFRNKIQIGDKVTRNKDGVLVNLSQLNRVAKQGEQKPAWSEEDEKILSDIIKDLVHPWNEYIPDRIEDEIKWLKNKLKTIKDRVQPQPKPEWSEEDETVRNNIIAKLAILKSRAVDGGAEKEICEMEINWLKSLKDRYTWKPSERQKEALLWCVVHLGGADKQTLGELLEALNKL